MSDKYYCEKCKRNHYRGQIYEDHLKYKKPEIPDDDFLPFDEDKLPNVALRQIQSLLRRMTKSEDKRLYIKEINKILVEENAYRN